MIPARKSSHPHPHLLADDILCFSTCTDYLLPEGCNDLGRILLDLGITLSLDKWLTIIPRYHICDVHLYPLEDPDDVIHDSDCAKMVMARTEIGLENLLKQEIILRYISHSEGRLLYTLATMLGWALGCELLWSYSVPLAGTITRQSASATVKYFNNDRIADMPLLELAVSSGQKDTLEFWLSRQWTLSVEEFDQIGPLDGNIVDTTPAHLFDTVLDSVVLQREKLQSLAEENLDRNESRLHSKGLLDVNAFTVVDKLTQKGITVHPSLRPTRRTIWYQYLAYANAVDCSRRLYDVGFRDLTSAPISPLLWWLTTVHFIECAAEMMELVEWFISKGATLYERWPLSDTTALHCLAWQFGRCVPWRTRIIPPDLASRISDFLSDTFCDTCSCGCSTSGCLFITIFFRSFLEAHEDEFSSLTSTMFCRLVSKFLESANGRPMLSQVIRSTIFWTLGLRHTCCDIRRIIHGSYNEFDPFKSPSPCYPPQTTARILEEDAYLLDLLEQLVPELNEKYDRSGMGEQQFFVDILYPRMNEVLAQLAEEDKQKYETGRRELGVIMKVLPENRGKYSEDDDDEDDEDVQEESSEEESE